MLMKRFIVVVGIACASGAVGRTQSSGSSPAALSEFFKPGVVFQDRNGDEAIDFVNARIVLAESPTAAELAAAADVAARLGFETSAMNIPVADGARTAQPGGGDTPSIFVGAKALEGSGATAASIGASALKAGEGAVAAFSAAGAPSVAIVGADDAGMTAAAVMFAGHLPYLSDAKSPTVDKIAEEAKQWLTGKGVAVSSAVAPTVVVKGGTAGVERLVVDATMANGGDLLKAQVA